MKSIDVWPIKYMGNSKEGLLRKSSPFCNVKMKYRIIIKNMIEFVFEDNNYSLMK